MNIDADAFYELHGVPPPHLLEQVASEIPDIPDLDVADYSGTIRVLKNQKGYSFRAIVEFLAGYNIQTNRSAVYRIYKESTKPVEERDDPLIDDETGEVVEE